MTVKVATPLALVVPEAGVMVLFVLLTRVTVIALPETGLPAPSRNVTVMTEVLKPSAATVVGAATAVDRDVLTDCTVRLALAALAVRPLLEVMLPVLFVLVPVLVGVTLDVTLQLPLAGMVPPLSVSEEPPAEAVSVPPQVLLVVSGEAIFRPAGKLSLKATPVRATLLGLVSVMVLVLVPFTPIVAGLKLVLTVGAAFEKTIVLLWVQVLLLIVTVTVWATVLVAVMLIGVLFFRLWVKVCSPLLKRAEPVIVSVVV